MHNSPVVRKATPVEVINQAPGLDNVGDTEPVSVTMPKLLITVPLNTA